MLNFLPKCFSILLLLLTTCPNGFIVTGCIRYNNLLIWAAIYAAVSIEPNSTMVKNYPKQRCVIDKINLIDSLRWSSRPLKRTDVTDSRFKSRSLLILSVSVTRQSRSYCILDLSLVNEIDVIVSISVFISISVFRVTWPDQNYNVYPTKEPPVARVVIVTRK